MLILRVVLMLTIGLILLRAEMVSGQNYPNKPIRMITGEIGGGNDFAARLIAPKMSIGLGQPAYNALIAGEVQLMFPAAGAVTQYVKSGRLRALAVTSSEPSALFPGLPTVTGAGLPGYESVLMLGIFAAAKTPEAIINRLNQEIARVLDQQDVKEQFFRAGVEIVGGSPEALAAKVKADIARMGKVINDAGIKTE